MPELPEVEVYKQYFDGTSLNHRIVSIDIDDPRLVKQPNENFIKALISSSFTHSDRIGKFFFAHTSSDKVVIFHFGLTGNFYYFNESEDTPRFTRVLFHFDNGFKLAFVNMRKFGWVDLIDDVEDYREKRGLGQDAQKISYDEFYEKFRKRKSIIKPKLLDQKLIAGVGNWIADEILYQSQLHPESNIENLSDDELKVIFEKMQHILEVAVREDANYEQFPHYFFIHIRKKVDAKCFYTGGPIEKIEVGGRGTYFSPKYQIKK